jgi:uncharacterized delta-60 repeat protein
MVVRLHPRGRFDRSFGGDGIITRHGHHWGGMWDVAVAADGDLLFAGGSATRAVVARLTPTGRNDNSFGVRGRRVLEVPGTWVIYNQVLEQPDGSIVAVGYGYGEQRALVARHTADGDLDPTFSGDGWTAVDVSDILGPSMFAGGAVLDDDAILAMVQVGYTTTLTTFEQ